MNALAAQRGDDLLAELAQAHAVEGQLRILFGHAKNVTAGRSGIHAHQQVG